MFSTHPFQIQRMTLYVQFAALSDPINLIDGLDHTYPPAKVSTYLSVRVTIHLGPQPLDRQSD